VLRDNKRMIRMEGKGKREEEKGKRELGGWGEKKRKWWGKGERLEDRFLECSRIEK